jgi:AhpD family alkylhydroperoxidase
VDASHPWRVVCLHDKTPDADVTAAAAGRGAAVTFLRAALSLLQTRGSRLADAEHRESGQPHDMQEARTMQARIDHPAQTLPGAMEALMKLHKATHKAGVPTATYELLHLRASQINGCSGCVDMHSRALKAAGEPDERIALVAAWCEASYFTDAERAALALTEAMTRIADRPDPVPDEVWDEAARHYDETQLAALVLSIASINAWNRLNVATRQIAGEWVAQAIDTEPAGQAA